MREKTPHIELTALARAIEEYLRAPGYGPACSLEIALREAIEAWAHYAPEMLGDVEKGGHDV